MKISDLIDFNPTERIPRGEIVPHVDMASLPTRERQVQDISEKSFGGSGAKFRDKDTLFARITPCLENGKGAQVSGLGANTVGFGSTEFIVMRAKRPSDEDFIYYLSRYEPFRRYAEKHMSGTSGRQRVSWQSLAEFELTDIDPFQRSAGAKVLSALDDKIELNKLVNETLEEIVRIIFKSWFVDFDPVYAKVKGLKPAHMDDETAALFPFAFNDDGLPAGWSKVRLEEVSDKIAMGPFGSSIKVATFVDEGVPVISGAHLNETMLEDGAFNFVSYEHAERLRNSNVFPGDVVFTHAGNIGQVSYIPEGSKFERYQLSQRQFYMRCKQGVVVPRYIVSFFKSRLGRHELLANTSQTGVPSIARPTSHLKSIKIPLPDYPVMEQFDQISGRLHETISANIRENQILAEIRDGLLPRLISGDVRIENVDKVKEAH